MAATAEGFGHDPPVVVLRDWAVGHLAPMTLIGFLSLFSPAELGVLFTLLAGLTVLVILLSARWRVKWYGSWLTKPIALLRLPRIGVRVRTAMVLIAILGVYLGCETVAWRNWRLGDRYRRVAANYASAEARYRQSLKSVESERAGLSRAPRRGRPTTP